MLSIIPFLINLLIVLGVLAVLWWGYTKIAPELPSSGPMRIVIVIIVVIVAIALLLWLGGMLPTSSWRLR